MIFELCEEEDIIFIINFFMKVSVLHKWEFIYEIAFGKFQIHFRKGIGELLQ